jgi:hypothetical protein
MNYYGRWMYSTDGNLNRAGAPFLLSVVGWFLLTILCQKTKMEEFTGLDLAAWNFGIGLVFFTLSNISIF